MFRLSILLCASAVSHAIKHRNVTFWYTPAATWTRSPGCRSFMTFQRNLWGDSCVPSPLLLPVSFET